MNVAIAAMTYREAVTEARGLTKLSEAALWRLAQLTWEQVESGTTREKWASDIGVGTTWASYLYKVWGQFHLVKPLPKFNEAIAKVRGGSTHELAVEQGARQTFAALPAKQRQQLVVEEIKREPELMRTAIRTDPELARAANEAQESLVADSVRKSRDRADSQTVARHDEYEREVKEFIDATNAYRERVKGTIHPAALRKFSPEARAFVSRLLSRTISDVAELKGKFDV